ncbi:uncharacterized protein LOC122055976 isoform X2 [Zingiber officinale]|uniref:uncharacterized protein LOC122055976 isoform X2 n=1 Tax=Zingiber officinale TaxID=94328 RepID=UPI001C4CAA7E|nr:uncharacterized protein LOC122055976 isoform X2 [Zingiber officinale]
MSESDTMDCAWIVEFLLRQSDADKLTTEAFRTLPLPSPLSFRLRLAALLRRLTSDLSLGFPALRQLQVILEDTSAASSSFYGSLVEAYRAVAFDCLAEALSSSDRALAAVVVTLCSRVAEIERDGSDVLASLPLRHLLEDVKAAASGSGSLLLERNAKNGASDAIRACLTAVLNDSGPSFLEKEALDKNATTSGELCVEDEGDQPDVKMIDVNTGSRELESASMYKDVQSNVVQIDKNFQVTTPEYGKTVEAFKSSCTDLQAAVVDPLQCALKKAEEVLANKSVVKTFDAESNGIQYQQGVNRPTSSVEKEADNVETKGTSNNQVEQLNDAFKSNKDPLPEKQLNGTKKMLADAASNVGIKVTRKLSLMDKNPTAHTYEWGDDSIESTSETSETSSKKICLPSPRCTKPSPLTLMEKTNCGDRKRKKKWSQLEEDTLRTAVARFGKGNWKMILKTYTDILGDRTGVDLKDKWRNMTRKKVLV